MSVLITGGCGYVGTKLTQAVLTGTAHEVTVLDTQWFGNHLSPDPRLTVLRAASDDRRVDSVTSYGLPSGQHRQRSAVDLKPLFFMEVNGRRIASSIARRAGSHHYLDSSSSSTSQEELAQRGARSLPCRIQQEQMVAERVVKRTRCVTTTITAGNSVRLFHADEARFAGHMRRCRRGRRRHHRVRGDQTVRTSTTISCLYLCPRSRLEGLYTRLRERTAAKSRSGSRRGAGRDKGAFGNDPR